MYKFMQRMHDVFALKLLDDDAVMNLESILALRRYKEMVSKQQEDIQSEKIDFLDFLL